MRLKSMTIQNDYEVLFDEYPDEKLARIKLTTMAQIIQKINLDMLNGF